MGHLTSSVRCGLRCGKRPVNGAPVAGNLRGDAKFRDLHLPTRKVGWGPGSERAPKREIRFLFALLHFDADGMESSKFQAAACLDMGSALTSIFFGSAAAEMAAVISSMPLRYSADSLSLSTPSGSKRLRWNEP